MKLASLAVFSAISLASFAAFAADDYTITLKDHAFSPAEITIPAGQKVKLTVKNDQSQAAEWESSDLNREKVVQANSQITVFVGPVDAGTYSYFDDFHRETTGTIIAK